MARMICSYARKTKLRTTKLKRQRATLKELNLKSTKRKKLCPDEFYPILDNQHSHKSRTTE